MVAEEILLSDMASKEWREYAMMVIAQRAIPCVVDGLKPVQRYLLYLALDDGKSFKKVAAYAGNLAGAGYDHGEASGEEAMAKMTARAQTTLPLFDGDGNFGNKLDKSCAQARYIFAKQSKFLPLLFKDMDLCPEDPDPEQEPPLYYLPIIPMVLVNGTKGIAVGWSCDIPSHTPESVIDSLIGLCEGRSVSSITPTYPLFTGSIYREPDHYRIEGKWKRESQTKLRITEIPPTYDQDSYQAVLDKLQEKSYIVDYEDNSKGDYYDILVTLKRAKTYTDADIWDKFKLRTTHKWNVNTISPDGKLMEWKGENVFEDIVKWFYDFRLPFIGERIQRKIKALELEILYKGAYIEFCKDVVAGKFSWKINEDQFEECLLKNYGMPEEYISKTMNTPARSFTVENMAKAQKDLEALKKELDYYKKTTPEKEYKKDLLALRKAIGE